MICDRDVESLASAGEVGGAFALRRAGDPPGGLGGRAGAHGGPVGGEKGGGP